MNALYPSLYGRLVLVTGGASGIGAAISSEFIRQGARVICLDIVLPNHHPSELSKTNKTILYKVCDVTDVVQVEKVISDIGEPVDILVNNVGYDERHSFLDVTEDMFDSLINVNLKHYFFTTQAVVKSRNNTPSPLSVVNIGSMTFYNGNPELSVYVAAKGGVLGLTRSLARKLGPEGVRVNCVMPGWVRTERQERLWLTPEGDAHRLATQSLKDWVMPRDVANMVMFLASDDSRMCTGQQFVVDGGRWSV